MNTKQIVLPYKYKPRPYQIPFFNALQEGYKRFDLVWHRRAGKDLTVINATAMAMADTDNKTGYGGVGTYYYFFPTFAQGKKVIWDGTTRGGIRFIDFIPEELRAATWNDEMKIRLKNGSLFQIVGTDNYDCYDELTEILTKEGWKKFKDISDNEVVATLKDGELVYENITSKVEYGYKGDMYRVKSKSVDILTTPNHKFFVKSRKGVYKFREIRDINIYNDMIPATCKWKGKSTDKFILGNLKFKMSDWCAFIGIFLSEGSTFKNHKAYRTIISQSNKANPEIVEEIKALLERMNLNYHYDGKNFNIENKDLYNFCVRFGKCDEKYIPRNLLELSPKYLTILKDWLIKGDGHVQKDGHEIYYTTSKRLVDDFQELVIKLGLSGNIKIKDNDGGTIDGRKINSKKTLYELYIRKGKYKYFCKTGESYINKEFYDGKVYCVEVPSHVIKVRRNGCEVWCGNSIMGTNPIWCIFSEYALQNPLAWEYIRPILRENKGRAIFIYTPRGRNHGYTLHYDVAKLNPDTWFSQVLPISVTGVLTEKDIEEERREGMSEELIAQEYYCSFEMGIEGSYYGREIQKLRDEDRITKVPIDSSKPVHTAWDIGVTDFTSIIFYQVYPTRYHIVDFYQNMGEGVQHYADILNQKGYVYGNHYGGHDLKARQWVSEGKPTIEVAREYGINFQVVPKLSIQDGIQAGRSLFSRCYFDEEKTHKLLVHLENYSKVWSKTMNCYTSTPKKDGNDHAADAWRYFAVAEKSPEILGQFNEEDYEKELEYVSQYSNRFSGM